jgi:hypothetical protein
MKNEIIKVYNFTQETREFLGESDAYITDGLGLPANSTKIKPVECQNGFVMVWNGDSWEPVLDMRGTVIFNTETKASIVFNELGDLPKGYTHLKPNACDKWTGERWEHDLELERASKLSALAIEKAEKIKEANELISILQDAVDLEIATDEEDIRLKEWKKYRVLLSRININDINLTFPALPE